MANFCTNCGSKLEFYYNYCVNCGAKIDKYGMNHNQYSESVEKNRAKQELKRVVGGTLLGNTTFHSKLIENGLDIVKTGSAIRKQVEKEIESGQIKSEDVESRVNQLIQEYKIKNEEENARIAKEKEEVMKILKRIDAIFESEEIQSEIRKNNIDRIHVISIKDSLKNKLINKREHMSDGEIKYFIKTELEKVRKEQENIRIAKEKVMQKNEMNHGGYCSLNCRYCLEEFLDSGGGLVGDFTADGSVEYRCDLGHPISYGSFCEDYE